MNTLLPTKEFLNKLEEELKSLPSWKKQKFREESWMTSLEIEAWCHANNLGKYSEKVIEEFLVSKWEKNKLENIRPAKYPHSKNLCTLWGHIKRVYPQKNKIQLSNTTTAKTYPRFYYSQNKLQKNAPIIFLSHNLKDFENAVQISNQINKLYGYRTWLCEKRLDYKAYINQEIRKSISQCDALLVLLSYHSLGSAYVHSEILTAGQQNIPINIVINTDDNDLIEVVEAYIKDPYSSDLTPLLNKYKNIVKDEHKISRYKKNAVNILSILQNTNEILIYPSLPAKYSNSKFKGFEKALRVKQKK